MASTNFEFSLREKEEHQPLYETNFPYSIEQGIKANEFSIFYQPIFNKHKQIIKVEALARWQITSTKEWIPPSLFLPLAKGLDLDLEKHLFKKAIEDLNCFTDLKIITNINLSLDELIKDWFWEFSNSLELKYKKIIRIEITEECLLEKKHIDRIDSLLEIGIQVGIDDFGVGNWSICHLADLKASFIKLDKNIVNKLEEISYRKLITEVVSYCKKTKKMTITAEGIETEKEWKFCLEAGIEFFQGYWLSSPMEKKKVLDLIVEQNLNRIRGNNDSILQFY